MQKLINQLKQLSRTEYIDPAAFVGIYVRFGDKDQAFAWLEKGYDAGGTDPNLTEARSADGIRLRL